MLKKLAAFILLFTIHTPAWADTAVAGPTGNALQASGGTLSGPLLVPNGSSGTPSFAASTNPDTGLYYSGGGPFPTWTIEGTPRQIYLGTEVQHASTVLLSWCSGGSLGCSPDLAIGRSAAGVAKIMSNATTTRSLIGGGTAVASAAALPLPTGNIFHVTGTTNITSITSTNLDTGVCISMIFDGILTVTDGGTLKLAGDFVTTADDVLSVCYDGTNWYETSRSVN